MSILASSSLFPPSYDQDSGFTVIFNKVSNLSDILNSRVTNQCNICGAYLLQGENLCPVCKPDMLYNVFGTTHFKEFRIEKQTLTKQPPILILVDLDIDTEYLLMLLKEIQNDTNLMNSDILFLLAMIGENVFFCKSESISSEDNDSISSLNFTGVDSIDSFKPYIAPLGVLLPLFSSSIKIAKKFLSPSSDKSKQIQNLFSFLKMKLANKSDSSMVSIYDIQNIIYFFCGNLSTSFNNEIPHIRWHFIQIDGFPLDSKKANSTNNEKQFSNNEKIQNLDFATKMNASYTVLNLNPEIGQGAINPSRFLHNYINLQILYKPKIQVRLSEGLEIKEFYGPVKSVSKTKISKALQYYDVDLFFYSNQIPLNGIIKATKDAYNKIRFFSAQYIFSIYPESLLIVNEVWKKANDLIHWISSIHKKYFLPSYIQRKVTDALKKKIPIHFQWVIPQRKISFKNVPQKSESINTVKHFQTQCEVFESLIINVLSSNLYFSDFQKAHFIVMFFYGSPLFFDTLYNALIELPLQDNAIYFPPYIVIKGNISQIPQTENSSSAFSQFNFSTIQIDPSAFNQLYKEIKSARNSFTE